MDESTTPLDAHLQAPAKSKLSKFLELTKTKVPEYEVQEHPLGKLASIEYLDTLAPP